MGKTTTAKSTLPQSNLGIGKLFELGKMFLDDLPRAVQTSSDMGKIIKKIRKDKKLSQQELADLSGVGRRFISELENGKPSLEFEKVLKVASSCGIDLILRKR
jgi:y4mF family transcriptional regulator